MPFFFDKMHNSRKKYAAIAFGYHFVGSVALGLISASLVFFLWFPKPLDNLSGGMRLLGLLLLVDLFCGPLLTAIVTDQKKSKRHQIGDWATIVLIQVGALIYGVYSIGMARPVAVVFEVDRFVAISAANINPIFLEDAPEKFKNLSWTGPIWVGVRSPKSDEERMQSIDLSMQGIEPSARPNWWQDISLSRDDILERAHSLRDRIMKLPPDMRSYIIDYTKATDLHVEELSYLPLVSSKSLDSWIALINKNGDVVGYAPIGGFDY